MKILIILLLFSSIYATEYCNKLAKVEPWKEGIYKKTVVENIIKKFPKSQSKLIEFLDKLSIENSEKKLLSYIKIKTQTPVIRLRQDSPRFQWEINKEDSSIGIVIHYYKNCISQIMLMDMKSSKVYSRYTTLSQKKL